MAERATAVAPRPGPSDEVYDVLARLIVTVENRLAATNNDTTTKEHQR